MFNADSKGVKAVSGSKVYLAYFNALNTGMVAASEASGCIPGGWPRSTGRRECLPGGAPAAGVPPLGGAHLLHGRRRGRKGNVKAARVKEGQGHGS